MIPASSSKDYPRPCIAGLTSGQAPNAVPSRFRRRCREAGAVSALILLVAMLSGCDRPADPAAEQPAAPPVTYQQLVGQWTRTDGTYTLDVSSVTADGAAQVGYFNPRPINVSRAEAGREEDLLKLFVELQDTGYPGCVYTLQYDPKTDRLWGMYYQAGMGQRFDVAFTRAR